MEPVLTLDPAIPYRELRDPPLPEAVRVLALDCFAAQRRAAAALAPDGEEARASEVEPEAVSAAALERLLASGRTVGGIVTQREVATAIPFNARLARDVVWSRDVAARRGALDTALARWVTTLFAPAREPILMPAGQWWYPPGTHFGWHTNDAYPGWRLYLSHAEEEGRSLFRYRDPSSGAVVTSPDARWHLRLFAISAERPLWHAIASSTHRFSIGWHVRPWSLRDATVVRVKRMLGV